MKSKKADPQPLQSGDYYFNSQGLMVFTKQYHLRRGYCCGSGCRHCPWRQKSPQQDRQQQEKDNK
ncbi:DUF5522 domain-containing protein [Cesiribacter sp. SM1]|uniref:DUF5522 domain-containing protein n=1 Tax=Cesiribacter sp. SM1 TaxID=2861196 RepID=UPI001CD34D60|nr:DUF5522 domain-containing protein [Cesiribacter sp. SM1]